MYAMVFSVFVLEMPVTSTINFFYVYCNTIICKYICSSKI